MGIYCKVACDETRESIDPGLINNSGIKIQHLGRRNHPLGPLVMHVLTWRWQGKSCRVVDDSGDDPAYDAYVDITESMIADYNSSLGPDEERLAFTP
jgi:hypothetical protein